jgi:hypothetical protein
MSRLRDEGEWRLRMIQASSGANWPNRAVPPLIDLWGAR